jgi:hypothetical protein
MNRIIQNYQDRVETLQDIYYEFGPRACANESGKVFELLVDDVVSDFQTLKSLENDYLKVQLEQCTMDNVQVDRHIRNEYNQLIAVVESKVYLDACYCKRAVVDFLEVSSSDNLDSDVEYVIVTGQTSIKTETYNYYQELCKKFTGKYFNLFVLNEDTKRSSKKPLYKERFKLNETELKRFYDYVSELASK